ncbi:MAG: beta-mannosidase [Ruminococcus sp.]|nr:beta-mannosidase [Ruminococcus sp.]
MGKKLIKLNALLTAAALGIGVCYTLPNYVMAGKGFVWITETGAVSFKSECEDLIIDGAEVATKVYNDEYPGYTGEGFVWVTNSGTMSVKVDAPKTGMYRLVSRCLMYLGNEGEIREAGVSVERSDGSTWSKTVKIPHTNSWNDFSFGDIKLTKGENTVTFGGGWGYCLYDSMTLTETDAPDYSKATAELNDPNATPEAKSLMGYLKSVYGSHIISGQQEIYGGGNDGNSELEFDYIKDTTGKLPAIRGFDFMNYNPLYGWEDGTTERAIDWTKNKNGIVTASWHINVPINFENYVLGEPVDWKECSYKNYQASNSTFNTANVLVEGTKEYDYFQAAIEDLAEQLLILQENNVPIIFRPLHEAQGNEGNYGDGTSWFWWGDRGAEVFKELWKMLYTTLTEKYNLHNLIWEFNSYNYSNSPTWYPGDEYVDLVAYDKYNVDNGRDDGLTSGPNESAISAIYNYLVELTDGRKMVAMSENDTIPNIENLTVENAGWLYFCPWYGEHLMSERYQNADTLNEIYNSEYCITLDELPSDWLSAYVNGSSVTTTTMETTITIPVTTLENTTNVSTDTSTLTTKQTNTETTPASTSESIATTTETTWMTTTTTSTSPSTTLPLRVKLGDLNLDDGVSVVDMVYLNKYMVNIIKFNDQQKCNADCYSDGVIDSSDASALMQFLAQQIDSFPVGS